MLVERPMFLLQGSPLVWQIVRGDARALPLADASADLILTSPPYWGLRSYRDAGEHYSGQVGSESTPAQFVDELVGMIDGEWRRVLKPSGSMFLNLGDKYAGGRSGSSGWGKPRVLDGEHFGGPVLARQDADLEDSPVTDWGARPKSLLGLPWRIALALIDRGWILRAEIIWSKPNGLPESVTDRVRRSHEQVFHFVTEPRYYTAVDEIRSPGETGRPQRSRAVEIAKTAGLTAEHLAAAKSVGVSDVGRGAAVQSGAGKNTTEVRRLAAEAKEALGGYFREWLGSPSLGRLPGSVWTIPTQPLIVPDTHRQHWNLPNHFACVDEQTEILTRRGWLAHDRLTVEDMVAAYDPASRRAAWSPCLAVHRYDYDGEMVAVEKRNLSMLLTPNHRCVVRRPHSAMPNLDETVEAADLGPKHAIPRSVRWEGGAEDEAMGAYLAALYGWVAAEGWYQNDLVMLSQSGTANPDKVQAIDRLLAPILNDYPHRGGRWGRASYRKSLDGVRRSVKPDGEVTWRLPVWLSHKIQERMPDKQLGWWALDLTSREAMALLDAFTDGDGHRRRDGRIAIFQKGRANLDVLQAVAVSLGYKTALRPGDDRWVLYLTEGGRATSLRATDGKNIPIPRQHYQGVVWCPTVATGAFVARRSGIMFVTGNSYPPELCRRIILGWSPKKVCQACGEGRRPVVEKVTTGKDNSRLARSERIAGRIHLNDFDTLKRNHPDRIVGESCACPDTTAPTRPGVILDPMCGTGTTIGVAHKLGRNAVGVDLSGDYARLARWRIAESGHFDQVDQRTAREAQTVLGFGEL